MTQRLPTEASFPSWVCSYCPGARRCEATAPRPHAELTLLRDKALFGGTRAAWGLPGNVAQCHKHYSEEDDTKQNRSLRTVSAGPVPSLYIRAQGEQKINR